MTCYSELEEQSVLIVDGRGILGVWCCGSCLADIHAITFLREVEESVLHSIESRTVQDVSGDDEPEEDG